MSQDRSIEVMPNERALLGYFLARIQKIDPDVIVVSRVELRIYMGYLDLSKSFEKLQYFSYET